ncbi:hypothetical protein Acr_23g0016310 [Actinidia rufa]|uniref:Uncharacterized protein n=1 Tax=Actinidia rufa TaxID=165716 RepID=A0A7J0GR12_9ERIC|nr:hypothetical protein Acr_23g0016310 [Actinidia rufa]
MGTSDYTLFQDLGQIAPSEDSKLQDQQHEKKIVPTKEKGAESTMLVSSQISPSEDSKLQDQQHEKKIVPTEEKCTESTMLVSSQRIEKLSVGEFKNGDDDDDNDGFKTPTRSDQRIPRIPQCPPAPRKPKSCPCMRKRKSTPSQKTLIHVSNEVIESLFAPILVEDLGGKMIKKVRSVNGNID